MNRFALPAIAWIIISTILLTLPGSAFPEENWFDVIKLDKWIHIAMFGIMVFLLCWAIYKTQLSVEKKSKYFLLAALVCIAYGIAMEFVQKYYIPNRSFDVYDIGADTTGALLGLIFSRRWFIKK